MRPHLKNSENDTTLYSPKTLNMNQKNRGSSLDCSKLRHTYVSLCTSTNEVLNMSIRNKVGSSTIDEVCKASTTVIKFILEETIFQNSYSLIQFESTVINWQGGQDSTFHVPAGLMFPFLTAALLSYRSRGGILIIAESYGGKKRGVHIHWNFNETAPHQIKKVINDVKEAEKFKMPFIIKNAFRSLESINPSPVSNVTINWGLGCDARGDNLNQSEKSFLVCQPVIIESVDKKRIGSTADVFRKDINDIDEHYSSTTDTDNDEKNTFDTDPELIDDESVRIR